MITNYHTTIEKGVDQDQPDFFELAKVVSEVMEVPMLKIIGVYDTDAKIITCYFEILFKQMTVRDAAKKYSINHRYMIKRLSDLGEKLSTDQNLKRKFKCLGRIISSGERIRNQRSLSWDC